jgi:adenylyltransferase/sulfurtransferase
LKVESAAEALRDLNPLVTIIPIRARVTAANALELIGDYDVVIDGTDNFPSRYLLNDACALRGKPLIFGSIFRFEGQAAVFDARRGPCYRCLFPEPPAPAETPTCAEGGVLGALPGMIGAMQANEALKLLLDIGEPLRGRLLLLDALAMRVRELRVTKNPECPLCGATPTITSLAEADAYGQCALPSGAEGDWEMTPAELMSRLAAGSIRLVDVREEWEREEDPGFPDAVNLPYPLFARRINELDSADDIVLFCSAGVRSWQAAGLLRRGGFTRAWSLRGGLAAYRALNSRKAGS